MSTNSTAAGTFFSDSEKTARRSRRSWLSGTESGPGLSGTSLGGATTRAMAPRATNAFTALAKPAIQAPLKPSVDQEEEDAIQAFLSGN